MPASQIRLLPPDVWGLVMRHLDDECQYTMVFFAIYDHDTMAAAFGDASSSMDAFWYTKELAEWHGGHCAEDPATTSFLPCPDAEDRRYPLLNSLEPGDATPHFI